MPTADAIKRREVDIKEVALFESLGICFGRKPQKFEHEFSEVDGGIVRHL
jgi:6-phosphofructokinase 1